MALVNAPNALDDVVDLITPLFLLGVGT